jgi:hypothetical protein
MNKDGKSGPLRGVQIANDLVAPPNTRFTGKHRKGK